MFKTVIHLEPIDFAKTLYQTHQMVSARPYVLDCGIAVIVYLFYDDENLYYLDRVECSPLKQDQLDKVSFYDLHKDLYRKVNLDQRIRERAI